MGNCNCGPSKNIENINRLNEETLENNAIEKEIKEVERKIKAAEEKYQNNLEKIEMMRTKNEVIANMIEIEEDKKKENARKLEALTYTLMKHGVTEKSMDEAKASKGDLSFSSEEKNKINAASIDKDDNIDDDDVDVGPYSLLEMFDIAKVLEKFSKELEAIKAAQVATDGVIATGDAKVDPVVNNNEDGIDSRAEDKEDATAVPPTPPPADTANVHYSMVGWFLREELDENGYPSLISLMNYNDFKEIILSQVNTSNFTAGDADLLALRFSDENMVDVVEFIEYFELTLEERQRASAFNIMQMIPGQIKFPPELLPTPQVDASSSSSLETGSKLDIHQCTKLEFAANKLYMIFDSVVKELEEELSWAAEKNVAGSSRVNTSEFQRILGSCCSIDKVHTFKKSSTADVAFDDDHKVPYISKQDAILLSERFTFGYTGYVDYKVFINHFKGARSLDMGLRGTPYDVRVSTLPPPSPRRKKSDKEAIAVPEEKDNSNAAIELNDTERGKMVESIDGSTIPVSEEKSPAVKSEISSVKPLSAKASSKSVAKSKSTKKKKTKESKENKEVNNTRNNNMKDNTANIEVAKENNDENKSDGKVAAPAPPLTIVTSPTALKDTNSAPSLLSPSVKSPVSASSATTSVDIEELLENIRAMMEEQHEVDHVEATFKRFDKNSDGVLQKEEVKLTFEELNIPVSPADIQAIFDLFDKDKNGTIDYTEFIDVLCEM